MNLPTSTQEQSKDFTPVHLPEGIYIATLKEVKDISEGQYGPRLAFIYETLEPTAELALVCYKTKATEQNKLGQTLMAHGVKIDDSDADTDVILGSKVKAWVEDFKREIDGKQVLSSIITKVKPVEEKPQQ